VCVCVSFYYLLCVCVRASSSLILFCCSLFFFSFIKNSLIYSQLKRKNQQLYYLSFCVLVCSYLHGCCVCVVFFSVDYRWVSGCLYFIYLCVCMYVVYTYDRHRKKNNQENFCFVVKHGKTTELDFSFFLDGVIIYLYVCVFSVYLYVLFSVLKNNIHQRYINMILFNG